MPASRISVTHDTSLHLFRIFFWLFNFFGTTAFAFQQHPDKTIARPNILFIMSDDHAYQAIGAYPGRLQSLNPTPQIDRIAPAGMRFDRCLVTNSI